MDGSFTIPDLDPKLLFNLLAVAPEHEPQFLRHVDPAAGPARFELDPRSEVDAAQVLRGRIVDTDGRPVLGATVSPYARTVDERTTYGAIDELDPLAISDENGEFTLVGARPGATYIVEVRARALTPAFFEGLGPGKTRDLALGVGATIRGRLTHDGDPLDGVIVGAVQVDRGAGVFVGETTIATDDEGRFTLLNVAPGEPLFVYGKMASLEAGLAVPAVRIESPDHGGEIDVGELAAVPGLTLAGAVELTDGGELPAGTRILMSRDGAWDSKVVELGPDGAFEIDGLPPEKYSLSIRLRGYRLTRDNWSLDPLNLNSLDGWIRESKDDLLVVLEPGAPDYSREARDEEAIREFMSRREQPLRGAEDPK